MTLGIMATDVEQRIDFDALRTYKLQRVRDQLEEKDLGALLCLDMDNIRYLTSTHLAEWARDKFIRWCVLPRGGEPVLFELGSAAKVKRELCPWLKPENIRVATPWARGANLKAVNDFTSSNAARNIKFSRRSRAGIAATDLAKMPSAASVPSPSAKRTCRRRAPPKL
jgi:Xaa-Pro aminopeptidase